MIATMRWDLTHTWDALQMIVEEVLKMSLRLETPCDFGPCPYDAEYGYTCEYWCGTDEPEDYPYDEEDD